jgi:hypothetical protein
MAGSLGAYYAAGATVVLSDHGGQSQSGNRDFFPNVPGAPAEFARYAKASFFSCSQASL